MKESKRTRHDIAAANVHYMCAFAYVRGVIDEQAKQSPGEHCGVLFFGKKDVVRSSLRLYIEQFLPHDPTEFETILNRFYWQYYQQQREFLKSRK